MIHLFPTAAANVEAGGEDRPRRWRIALQSLGRPQDVAGAVCFLASDEASYINGENLMVDGGWMAS